MKNTNYTEVEVSKELMSYITFLKAGKLDEIINDVIRLSYEYKLPAMKQLEGVRPETIYYLTSIGINDFFNDILAEKPIEGLLRALDDWTNKRIGEEISTLTHNDIVTGYLIRKQVLIKKIPEYNTDPIIYINLVQELNNLIAQIEATALRALAIVI